MLACLLKVEASQPAMASNAAPPGIRNAAENAPTPFPYLTSARKHADLSADIADADKKTADADQKIADMAPMPACADEKVEGAGAKMGSTEANTACAAMKTAWSATRVAADLPFLGFVAAQHVTKASRLTHLAVEASARFRIPGTLRR